MFLFPIDSCLITHLFTTRYTGSQVGAKKVRVRPAKQVPKRAASRHRGIAVPGDRLHVVLDSYCWYIHMEYVNPHGICWCIKHISFYIVQNPFQKVYPHGIPILDFVLNGWFPL